MDSQGTLCKELTVCASAKISSDLAKVYTSVSTALIFNALDERVAKTGEKAAAEPAKKAAATVNFIVN